MFGTGVRKGMWRRQTSSASSPYSFESTNVTLLRHGKLDAIGLANSVLEYEALWRRDERACGLL